MGYAEQPVFLSVNTCKRFHGMSSFMLGCMIVNILWVNGHYVSVLHYG